ncbi:hypothetical protein FYJ44_01430 [Desulfovibrio sp. PG-178-WT-4]|uniref:Uncharacterized protein n=1 Tax=Desulfovibrio porci TaxID=2605782 RepID=A0A6L5XHT3_9BACT|nr:hypothetical protein [Desulfovibrio porci]MDY3809732.1 hypothetical protein [Desulfovibrio porci]MSS26730.1 hypothetical protein [Desulfovibrio porci]
MLNPREIMIVCKGEDKTSSIEDYKFDEERGNHLITFSNGRQYEYSKTNAAVLTPQPYASKGKYIFYRGAPVIDFERILLFANDSHSFLYVVKKNGKDFSAPESKFTVSESADLSPEGQKIFDYLRTIAGRTKPTMSNPHETGNGSSFLAKVYAKLDFIHPESALAAYLKPESNKQDRSAAGRDHFPFSF